MSFTRLWLNSSVKSQSAGDLMVHYSQFRTKNVHILTKFAGTAYCIAFAILSRQKSVSNDNTPITDLWYLYPCPSVIFFQI